MKTDLDLTVLADLPKEWRSAFERKVWANCVSHGWMSYCIGLPEDDPLGRFTDPDMAASWKMGYHQARAEAEKRRENS